LDLFLELNSSSLGRTAAVVWDRRRVANRHHTNARVRDRSDRRFTTATWTFHTHLTLMHARFVRLLRSFVRSLLRCEWRPFPRPTKTTSACRRLRDQVPLEIRDRDHRVIERRRNVHDAVGNVLLLFLAKDLLFSACFSHESFPIADFRLPILCCYFLPGAFFLAMVARRGPLRVRALVWVRCPRTGSARRWRKPR